jgi:hypothetical protein
MHFVQTVHRPNLLPHPPPPGCLAAHSLRLARVAPHPPPAPARATALRKPLGRRYKFFLPPTGPTDTCAVDQHGTSEGHKMQSPSLCTWDDDGEWWSGRAEIAYSISDDVGERRRWSNQNRILLGSALPFHPLLLCTLTYTSDGCRTRQPTTKTSKLFKKIKNIKASEGNSRVAIGW